MSEKSYQEPNANKLSTALAKSIDSKDLRSGLATTLDAGMDATISALHGVPFLGVMLGLARAGSDIRKHLEIKKIAKFLDEIAETPYEKRVAFTSKLRQDGKIEEFGYNILLLLDKLEDISKPSIIGRIMAAHIEDKVDYSTALRLCAMVGRCYVSDLEYLKSFKAGTQRGGSTVAAMLAADGFLQQAGIDGGDFSDPNSGGIIYEMNRYGKLILEYGL